mmetsp:Transcript_19645/g.52536  ORF Transcript_19645/g.52536 Transcript_19645/m.52536 type:complete len:220 (-) Transcript_19645:764-1423(-)
MHVLQRRPVVVLQRKLVPDLRQETVVDARVPDVVGHGGDEERELLQLAEEVLRARDPHEARHAMDYVRRVGEAVERHGKVLLLDRLQEPLQGQDVLLRGKEAVARLVEADDGELGHAPALLLGQPECVEAPGGVDFQRHSQVLDANGGRRRLLLLRHGHPSLSFFLLLHDVRAVHHAQDAYILGVHVLGLLRHAPRTGRLHLRDDGQLLHNLLEQLHLV